jgi:hypothetical protein
MNNISTPEGLGFSLINKREETAVPPIIYIANDPGFNQLVLTITNGTSANMTLKGGAPPAPDNLISFPTTLPTAVVLDFTPLLLNHLSPAAAAEVIEGIEISADGWTAKLYDQQKWVLSPNSNAAFNRNAAIKVQLSNFFYQGRQTEDFLNINFLNFPNVRNGVLQLPVAITHLPGHLQLNELRNRMTTYWIGGNNAVLTTSGGNAVHNSLAFAITNTSNQPINFDRDSQDAPYFEIHFSSTSSNTITAKSSNMVFDVVAYSKDQDAIIYQWVRHNGINQQFAFEPVGGGYFAIQSQNSNRYLEIKDGAVANGAQLVQGTFKINNDNQLFRLQNAGDGYYYIQSKPSGKYLEIKDNSTEVGAFIILANKADVNRQKFKIEKTDQQADPAALTTIDNLALINLSIEELYSNLWTVEKFSQAHSPFWRLTPQLQSGSILGTGDKATVAFRISDVVVPAWLGDGVSAMFINYYNIPGYEDGTLVLMIEKQHFQGSLPVGNINGSPSFSGLSVPVQWKRNGANGNETWVGVHDRLGVGTHNPEAKLQVINAPQDSNGNTLVLGPMGGTNLRLGYSTDYSWIQSHGSKPLHINELGNPVRLGHPSTYKNLEVWGRDFQLATRNENNRQWGFVNWTDDKFYFQYREADVFKKNAMWLDKDGTLTVDGKINFPGGGQGELSFVNNSLFLHNKATNCKVNLQNNGNAHLESATTTFAVQGDGNVVIYQKGRAVWATGTNLSDIRLKENLQPIDNALERVTSLNCISFEWKDKSIGDKRELGLVAQEVEQTFPELLQEINSESKLVRYEKFVPVLIEAMKEQQKMIEALQQTVEAMREDRESA